MALSRDGKLVAGAGYTGEVRVWRTGDGGLVRGGERFEATFERMKLGVGEVPRVLAMIQDALTLPARSEITLEGRIDRVRFKATVEKNRKGRVKVRVTGLPFGDRAQVIGFVAGLTQRGADECRVRTLVGNQPVEVNFTQSPPKKGPDA